MYSPLLGINFIGEFQVDKYITVNDAIVALEQASNAYFVENGTSDYSITDAQRDRYTFFRFTSRTVNDFSVFIIDERDDEKIDRVVFVWNDTPVNLNLTTTPSNTILTLKPGERFFVAMTSGQLYQMTPAFTGVTPYDIGTFYPGTPDANVTLLSYLTTRSGYFEDDFGGSRAKVVSNPTADYTINVLKNGVAIGSLTIDFAGGVTFASLTTGQQAFAPNDLITLKAPAIVDPTIADISITLAGYRSL